MMAVEAVNRAKAQKVPLWALAKGAGLSTSQLRYRANSGKSADKHLLKSLGILLYLKKAKKVSSKDLKRDWSIFQDRALKEVSDG